MTHLPIFTEPNSSALGKTQPPAGCSNGPDALPLLPAHRDRPPLGTLETAQGDTEDGQRAGVTVSEPVGDLVGARTGPSKGVPTPPLPAQSRTPPLTEDTDCPLCHGEGEVPVNPSWPDPQGETSVRCDCQRQEAA